MNKFLLGTTALVAASAFAAPAFAAERIQIDVRGYHVGGVSYTDADGSYANDYCGDCALPDSPAQGVADATFYDFTDGANEINFGSDSEIHFVGSSTLDNGLEVSFKAELELETDDDAWGEGDPDNIDEVYVQFDGGFGRVQFGQNDGVMDQMAVVAPLIFKEHGHIDPDLDPFDPYGYGNPIDTVGDFTGDDIKLIYFTPSMNGLQLGFSYTPNPCTNAQGYAGCIFNEFGRNYWEVAATWAASYNNVGFAFSGGYGQGESGSADDEPSEWTLGANVSFGGFTIGGSYKESDTWGSFDHDETHWDVGISYESGPWGFNLAYGNMDLDGQWNPITMSGSSYPNYYEAEAESWIGGITYNYGPGMQIGIGVTYLDAEDGYLDPTYFNGVYTGQYWAGWEGLDGTSVFIENAIAF